MVNAGRWFDSLTQSDGSAAASSGVTVYLPGTNTLATLYTNHAKGGTISNPTTTDSLGNLELYALPGEYELLRTGTSTRIKISVPVDPADVGSSGGTGPTGPAGADGNTILTGTGAPANSLGVNGNYYIDKSAWFIYGPKAAGVWPAGVSIIGPTGPQGPPGSASSVGATGPQGPQGIQGPAGPTGAAGADGNTILYGTGAPAAGVGVNNNFYIDRSAWTIYGPKAGGAWPAGVSLIGPTGPTGPAGSGGGGGSTALTIVHKVGDYTLVAADPDNMVIFDSGNTATQPTVINDTFTGANGTAPATLKEVALPAGSSLTIQSNQVEAVCGNAGSYAGGLSIMFAPDGTNLLVASDIDVTMTWRSVGETYPQISVRNSQAVPNGQQSLYAQLSNGSIKISRTEAYVNAVLLDTGVIPAGNTWYTTRFQCIGLVYKLWHVAGTVLDPNAAAQWTVTDSSSFGGTPLTVAGYALVPLGGGGAPNQHFQMDNLIVKAGAATTAGSKLILPSDANAAYPVGRSTYFMRASGDTTDVTVDKQAGVTVTTPDTLVLRKAGSQGTATKIGANAWAVVGDLV